jgi:hypothetical protein
MCGYFGVLIELVRLHMKEIDFCEKLSIIMQRLLDSDHKLMSEQLREIL